MVSDELKRTRPSASVTAAGVDHVRLSYHYLDAGDLDGYGSLLDEQAQLRRPDAPPGHGRAQVVRLQKILAGPMTRHEVVKVVAEGDTIAVTGRFTPPERDTAVEFADVFTLSDEGLLLSQHRYYFVAPA